MKNYQTLEFENQDDLDHKIKETLKLIGNSITELKLYQIDCERKCFE